MGPDDLRTCGSCLVRSCARQRPEDQRKYQWSDVCALRRGHENVEASGDGIDVRIAGRPVVSASGRSRDPRPRPAQHRQLQGHRSAGCPWERGAGVLSAHDILRRRSPSGDLRVAEPSAQGAKLVGGIFRDAVAPAGDRGVLCRRTSPASPFSRTTPSSPAMSRLACRPLGGAPTRAPHRC